MTSHTPHPDTHLYGLDDLCPRCDEHATHPFESLDYENLRNLAVRVRDGLPARSGNEARAMEIVAESMRRASLVEGVLA